ncbi:MAG: NYN domain-containing protein [Planctomycetota bacterium]|nr:NYN domain-containing protein [Planctomycetota bacterium]
MLLIDAYNLLHAALGPAGGARDLTVAQVAESIRKGRFRSHKVRFVCDDERPTVRPGDTGPRAQPFRVGAGMSVIFSGAGREADEVIEELIARDGAPGHLFVVSSDRRVIAAARKRRARSLSSEEFLRMLLADNAAAAREARVRPSPRDEVPLSPARVDGWIDSLRLRTDPVMNLPSSPAAELRARAEPSGKDVRGERHDPRRPASAEPAPPPPQPVDPLLLEAIRAFEGRVTLEELDMSRYLQPPPPGA